MTSALTSEHQAEFDETMRQIREGFDFIEKFDDPVAGIIALNGGFSLEAARKAGLLHG